MVTPAEANIVEVPANRATDSPNNDLQEMDRGEDNRQAQKIYYIQNYFMNSFNNRNVHMQNCGNHNYRRTTVTYHASNDVDELPYPRPDEAVSGPTPSTRPDPILTNPFLQTPNAVSNEIADAPLPMDYQPRLDPATSPRPLPLSDSSDYNVEHLEHVDCSLAPASSIQLSGSTLADVLTPQLVPLDVSIPSPKRSMTDPATRSPFFSILITSRSHISIPMHYVMLFSSAVLFCLVFFIIALHKRVLKEYINYVY
ncbi:hypothetical protein BYT27DRAFT_7186866 [Phlegmacium glaucopus]|nr:hypothetical protein BYT27DRAFT_7186863 [Phlegmacium glaucopus]KAF8810022.1 hypothetical protein BYT27DRAFT_7186866 [Phlegmacium glaucopus]